MKRTALTVAMAIILMLGALGCAGTNYVSHKEVGGYDVIQGGRTGIFGTDNSFVHITPKQSQTPVVIQVPVTTTSAQPSVEQSTKQEKIKLERSYTRSSKSWTGCPDKEPNPQAKNVRREEVTEKWTEEVLGPAPVAPMPTPAPAPVIVTPAQTPPAFWAGGNPSAGNLFAPAAAIASGMVGGAAALRPSHTDIGVGGSSSNIGNVEANSNAEINHSGNSGGGDKHKHHDK